MRYYVSTGVSLNTESRCWNGLPRAAALTSEEIFGRDDLRDVLRRIKERRSEILQPMSDFDNAEDAAQAVAQHFDPRSWNFRHTLPAELATIAVLYTAGRLTRRDEIILWYGDSNWPAAFVMAAILRGSGRFGNVRCLGPYNWYPTNSDDFAAAMARLWAEIDFRDASFILTGGFKAVLIEIARRLAEGQHKTSVFCLHEYGDQVIEISFGGGAPPPQAPVAAAAPTPPVTNTRLISGSTFPLGAP